MRAPGGVQTAIGKKALAALPWHEMRPHQEWTDPAATAEAWDKPYAAGIPGRLRVIYYPIGHLIPWQKPCVIKGFEPDVVYRGRFVDPRNGEVHESGDVQPASDGTWRVPPPVTMHDWVLVLEGRHGR